jgi:hypothetical protein
MIEELGYTPEVNDLPKGYGITKWQYLRWHREQEQQEEEPEQEPEKPQEQQNQQNQPEIQEEPEQPEKVEIRVSPQPMAQWSSVNSPRPAPMPSKSPSVADEKAPSFKHEGPQQSQFLPEERANASPAPSGKKQRSTAFRFTPEQRAYLEEKVARTGSNPDVYSRIEMASELGVEEKTIRVSESVPTRFLRLTENRIGLSIIAKRLIGEVWKIDHEMTSSMLTSILLHQLPSNGLKGHWMAMKL